MKSQDASVRVLMDIKSHDLLVKKPMKIPYRAVKDLFDLALNEPFNFNGQLLNQLITYADENLPGVRQSCEHVVFRRKVDSFLSWIAIFCFVSFLLELFMPGHETKTAHLSIMLLSLIFGSIASIIAIAYRPAEQQVKVFDDFLNSVTEILLAVDKNINDYLSHECQPKGEVIRDILRYWKFGQLKDSTGHMLDKIEAEALRLKPTPSLFQNAAWKFNDLLVHATSLKLTDKNPIPVDNGALKETALA